VDYGNRGVALIIRAFGRWVRIGVAVGSPPGSNIGWWGQRIPGGFSTINYRVGKRYSGPCLTLWVHTKPLP
jgi:hypothetical protein